ncbi:hypothetical protein AOLI_G00047530 [Acnodon oligacanthus]
MCGEEQRKGGAQALSHLLGVCHLVPPQRKEDVSTTSTSAPCFDDPSLFKPLMKRPQKIGATWPVLQREQSRAGWARWCLAMLRRPCMRTLRSARLSSSARCLSPLEPETERRRRREEVCCRGARRSSWSAAEGRRGDCV